MTGPNLQARGWKPLEVTDTVLVHTGRAMLHSVVVNGLTTVGDIEIYDGVDAATGTRIAVLHLDIATSISVQPITFIYDAEMVDGIFLDFLGNVAANLTVTWDG